MYDLFGGVQQWQMLVARCYRRVARLDTLATGARRSGALRGQEKKAKGPLSAGTHEQAGTGAVLCYVSPRGFSGRSFQLSSPSAERRHMGEDATSPPSGDAG